MIKKNFFVIGLDNLSTGKKIFLKKINKKKFKFYKVDLLKQKIDNFFKNVDIVFHLAANADVRYGLKHRHKDINQNIIVTHRILEQLIKNVLIKCFVVLFVVFIITVITLLQSNNSSIFF